VTGIWRQKCEKIRKDITEGKKGLRLDLRIKVVAEGVEDETTWQMLSLLGCDYAQGWYVSRALPADQLEAWLRTSRWGIADPG